jgi:hypothetical protein
MIILHVTTTKSVGVGSVFQTVFPTNRSPTLVTCLYAHVNRAPFAIARGRMDDSRAQVLGG